MKWQEQWKQVSKCNNPIIELLNNECLRKRIGLNARKTVEDNFSIDSNTNKYLNVLKAND